jgi:starch phosphorylase
MRAGLPPDWTSPVRSIEAQGGKKMNNKANVSSHLPQDLTKLRELADNLWWSWHPEARMIFKRLNRETWKESGHNPVKMLPRLGNEDIERAARSPEYKRHLDQVLARFRKDLDPKEGWFLEAVMDPKHYPCAYFSAEYGLHHSLPFYAGGLGFLAGDHIKEFSDLKVPLVAIGFMYPEGYVRQLIREDGWQVNVDQTLDRDAASISRVPGKDGKQLVIRVPLIEPPIFISVWKIDVGRIPLYLIDTDIELNDPWNRKISQHLYTGEIEQRLRQEIVLGIGGCEVLDALGIKHSIIHLNEGNPSFALLERLREQIQKGLNFEEAADRVRRTSILTTHTPVPAGHEVFPFDLMEKYFHSYWPVLGLDRGSFLQLGIHPGFSQAGFNMTAFALRFTGFHNAVSKKHAETARRMWQPLWPELPEEKVPIIPITNGVHLPTWLNPRLRQLFDRYLGPDWTENQDNPAVWELVDEIPDDELWKTHYWLKIKLIDAIRDRARQRWAQDHVTASLCAAEGIFLDPAVLTIGFARRFATYKRAGIIFSDLERLKKMLSHPWRAIQIIFAGKAHPADEPGKRMLQAVFNHCRNPQLAGRVAFVEDYGEQLAQYLVHGVDVWLNTPLPPLEASGTSGMKASLNGVPHLSILDGWWIEGYNQKNGWAFGGNEIQGDRDPADAGAVYELLEKRVIPLYYDVSDDGVPHGWAKLMKEAIKTVGPRFSARRMAKDYITKFYVKALKKA